MASPLCRGFAIPLRQTPAGMPQIPQNWKFGQNKGDLLRIVWAIPLCRFCSPQPTRHHVGPTSDKNRRLRRLVDIIRLSVISCAPRPVSQCITASTPQTANKHHEPHNNCRTDLHGILQRCCVCRRPSASVTEMIDLHWSRARCDVKQWQVASDSSINGRLHE